MTARARPDPGDSPTRVLFVCLGNICRSPAAEAVMGGLVAAAGLQAVIQVDSAGTAAYHVGDPPDPRTRQEAELRGWPIDHRGRQVTLDDFEAFDLVLGMDHANMAELRSRSPQRHLHKLGLLREFDPSAPVGAEVPDPYYGSQADFAHVYDLCEVACAGLLDHVGTIRTR